MQGGVRGVSRPRLGHMGDVRPREEFGVYFQCDERPLDDFRARSVMM